MSKFKYLENQFGLGIVALLIILIIYLISLLI